MPFCGPAERTPVGARQRNWDLAQKGGVRMRYAVLALLVPALAVGAAQDNEAEKLYRQVEKKVAEAKNLRVVSDVEVGGEGTRFKGTLTTAGDKYRLVVAMEKGDQTANMEAISDGKTLKTTDPRGKTEEAAAPKNMGPALCKLVARVGLIGVLRSVRAREGKELNPDELLPASDFKMGEPAKVNGRDA